ncbi:MAG: thermopsin family protease [Thermoplasmata archaeon]
MPSICSPARLAWVVGVLALLLSSTFAVGTTGAGMPYHPATLGTPTAPSPLPDRAAGAAPDRARPDSGPGVSPVVAKAEREIADGKFDGRNAFLPTPYSHFTNPPLGTAVSPGPASGPAPMGIADLGIGPSGTPYNYGTSSVEGTLGLHSFAAYSPGYAPYHEAPDWTTIQLNAVGVNISYPGSSAGTFWFQNVVHFNGTELEFEDNIWNFSSPSSIVAPGTILSHGPTGAIGLNEFYYDYGPTCQVSYPFSLSLSLSLTLVGGDPAAVFNYTVTDSTCSGPTGGTYDTVVFNGAAAGGPKFEVNGGTYDPFGNEYDAELTIGGDGGGTNANIVALQGNATLSRWDSATHRYVSVGSAYDRGADSGETSVGVAAYYLTAPTTEFLDQGPSLLYGLWNTSTVGATLAATPGSIHIDITLTPSYGFLFATYKNLTTGSLAKANYTYVPTDASGVAVTELPPPPSGDPYVFAAWADGSLNNSTVVGHSSSRTLALVTSASVLDAPIYLHGDAQLAAFGAAGLPHTGYASHTRTLWINASQAALAAPFLRVNGFDYPTFVLFAGDRLNSSVRLDGLTQAAATYTSSNPLLPLPSPMWTQGYFFFYGLGHFSVSNTTLTGNTTLYYRSIASPASIEFYGTSGASASHIVSAQESWGVSVIASTGATLDHISAIQGANGISVVNSSTVVVQKLFATGTDYDGSASVGAYLDLSSDLSFSGLTAANGSFGVYAQSTAGLTARDVVATTAISSRPSVGFDLNATDHVVIRGLSLDLSDGVLAVASSDATIRDLNATASPSAGSWQNSSHLFVDGLLSQAASFGVDFFNDTLVTVENATVLGQSTGIDAFDNSTGGLFENVRAVNGSFGLQAAVAQGLTLTNFSAVNGSVGASLSNASSVRASGFTATNLSEALLWDFGTNGSIRNVTLGSDSLGVEVSNATEFTVRGVQANESALPASPADYYLTNPITYQLQPSAAVVLYNVANGTVENVSAHYYPFTVWANCTNYSLLENVTDWSGSTGILLNGSTSTEIAAAFLYGNEIGAYLGNTTRSTITGSTFEGSSSFGVRVQNGTADRIDGNNFVANNGANTKGTFAAAHVQARVNNSTKVFFNTTAGVGNYWSDHSGSGAYVIHNNPTLLEDHHPEPAFISHWLQFAAVGLPSLTPWGFALVSTDYFATVPLVFIPSWSLPETPAIPYTVLPTPGFVPHPRFGTTPPLDGKNQTVTIDFATLYAVTFSETGLPTGRPWSVTLNGTLSPPTTAPSSIVFEMVDGAYGYSIANVPGWNESSLARTGTVTVSGADVNEKAIAWVPTTYKVTFTETGLSGKPKWSVTLNTTSLAPVGTSVVFKVPNGTYPYSVTNPSGYAAGKSSGSVTVQGANAEVTVAFNVSASPSPAASVPWLYIGVGVAAALAVVAIAVLLRARRRRGPPKKKEDFEI